MTKQELIEKIDKNVEDMQLTFGISYGPESEVIEPHLLEVGSHLLTLGNL
jgi:hypothetical protein